MLFPIGRAVSGQKINFCLVQGNVSRNHLSRNQTDTEAREESPSDEQGNVRGRRLKDDADSEDNRRDHQPEFATNPVGERTGREGAEEGAGGEQGDDFRRLSGRDAPEIRLGVDVTGREGVQPVPHGEDAADGTSEVVVSIDTDDDDGRRGGLMYRIRTTLLRRRQRTRP